MGEKSRKKKHQQHKIQRKSKINIWLVLAVVLLIGAAFGTRFYMDIAKEQKAVRALVIEDQDLSSAHDGIFFGEFTYGGFTYRVNVTIESYNIKGIEIVNNRTTKYAKMAEGVVDKILAKGNVNVEVVSGATTSSKALLKAIEQAISCNL